MAGYRFPPSVREIRRSLIRLLTEDEKATLARRKDPLTVESIADFIHEDALRVLRGDRDAVFWESLRGLPADEQLRRMKLRKDAA